MRYIKPLLVLAVLGAYPATALAHRAPTTRERAALVKAFDRYVREPVPARCLKEEISTASRSWAQVQFGFDKHGHLPAGCAKFAANGVVLFHFRAGRWRFVTAGSSFINSNGSCGLTGKVPRKVIADFRLC
jgi:hypothetical protein